MNGHPMLMRPADAFGLHERARAMAAAGVRPAPPERRLLNLPARYADRVTEESGPFGMLSRLGPLGIVHIDGPMWYSAHSWAAMCGGGSISGFIRAVEELTDDASIRAIALSVHTPGGDANPLEDLVNTVGRAAAAKPVLARVYNAYSMGVAAVCKATEVSISRTAMIGCIGSLVYMVDDSAMLAAEGVRVLAAASPSGKLACAPGQPLGDDVLAELQAQVDRCADEFIAAVAEGRGLDPAVVRGWDAAEFFGPEAKAVGLVDVVEDEASFWERAVAIAGVDGPAKSTPGTRRVAAARHAGPARSTKGGHQMATNDTGGASTMTARQLLAKAQNSLDPTVLATLKGMVEEPDPEEDPKAAADPETDPEEDPKAANTPANRARARGEAAATFDQLEQIVPAELPDRDSLITGMLREGVGVMGAQSRVQGHVLKAFKAAQTKADEAEAARAETGGYTAGRAALPGNRGGNGGAANAKAEFDAAVDAHAASYKCKRHEAVRAVVRAQPELHARMLKEVNADRGADRRAG